MKTQATRILAENDRTEDDLTVLANDSNPMIAMLARRAYLAVNDVESAQRQMEDATYWVRNAVEKAELFLSGEYNHINSLGILQGQGQALDVAVGRISQAIESATSALEALNEGIVIAG